MAASLVVEKWALAPAVVPAAHGVGCDTPTPHECPSGLEVQLACDSSPVALP